MCVLTAKELLQINATVLTGILILLTITSFSDEISLDVKHAQIDEEFRNIQEKQNEFDEEWVLTFTTKIEFLQITMLQIWKHYVYHVIEK